MFVIAVVAGIVIAAIVIGLSFVAVRSQGRADRKAEAEAGTPAHHLPVEDRVPGAHHDAPSAR